MLFSGWEWPFWITGMDAHTRTHTQNKHRACNFNFKILLIATNFSHGINMEIQTLVQISTPWWHEILNSFELKLEKQAEKTLSSVREQRSLWTINPFAVITKWSDCETERSGHQSEHSESRWTPNPYRGIAGPESGLQDTIWSRCWDSWVPTQEGSWGRLQPGLPGWGSGASPMQGPALDL